MASHSFPATLERDRVICLLCGVENDDDAKFCYSCGSRLWGTDSSESGPESGKNNPPVEPITTQTSPKDTARPLDVRRPMVAAPVENAEGSRNGFTSYLARHWRGELALPVSYWINVVLVGVALAVIIAALAQLTDWSASIWTILAVVLAAWLLVYITTTWQIVGAWRSASKHRERTGSGVWAVLAQIVLVLGAIQSVSVGLTQAIPQIAELVKVASGNDPAGRWQIRVIRNASELEVSGGIGFGLSSDLQRTLDAQPSVRLIHLNSDGGRIAEARRIRDLIEERGLSTYTATRCVSACVVAFIAGRQRLIGPGARLGFHGYTFPGLSDDDFAEELAADRRDFVRRGVDADFANRAFRSVTEVWYPERVDLLAARVVTKVAGLDDVGISGVALTVESVDKLLRSVKLFAAVADHDRETYTAILEEYKLAVQRGDSLGEVRRRTLPLAMKVVTERLPSASDDAVLSFVNLMLEQMQMLYAKDPAKCHAYVAGLDTTNLVADLAPTLEREQQITTDVIRSSAEERRQPPQQTAVAGDLERLWLSMAEWFGNDVSMLETPTDPGVDPKKYCEMTYAMYKGALGLPRPRAARLLKFILGPEAAK